MFFYFVSLSHAIPPRKLKAHALVLYYTRFLPALAIVAQPSVSVLAVCEDCFAALWLCRVVAALFFLHVVTGFIATPDSIVPAR